MIPEPLLSVFDFQEIELLLHGLPNIEMDDWIANVEYTGMCVYDMWCKCMLCVYACSVCVVCDVVYIIFEYSIRI